MTAKTVIGIVLIIIGILSLGYQGFSYTTHKKVVDIGSIQATKTEHKTVPLPPIIGILALAGGVVVLVAGRHDT
jgi:drug/metabolite transporter (DMT)-like permease